MLSRCFTLLLQMLLLPIVTVAHRPARTEKTIRAD